MITRHAGAIVKLQSSGRHLKICVLSNPGPFPFGPPKTTGRAQYIGIADHLVLTLVNDRDLVGLLPFQADVPYTADDTPIHWVGGVACQPYKGDTWYLINTLFLRDVGTLLAGQPELHVGAIVGGVNGQVTGRQYWLIEIPSLTRGVLLNLDEIVIVRRRRVYRPDKRLPAKVARGEFWQTAAFAEHPIYAERRR